jgi:release factor glutamine methyltransferase
MRPTARLVRQAAAVLTPGGLFALEVDVRRASIAAELVSRERRFGAIRVELDLTGRERFVLARRQEREGV